MSLYAEYLKEAHNKDIIETSYGFATYSHTPDGLYIEDVYVQPTFRNSGITKDFENQITSIAKDKGLKRIYSSVLFATTYANENIARMLKSGAKVFKSTNEIIFFYKDIK